MKKFCTTICTLSLSILAVTAQQVTPQYRPSEARSYQSLSGEIFTLSFFVNTRQASWGTAERDLYVDELQAAQGWLTEQAAAYGKEVRFNNDHFPQNYKLIYMEAVYPGVGRAMLAEAFKALQFQSLQHFLDWYHFDISKQKLKLVFFVKSNSRSHAYNFWALDDIDIAVVYARNYGTPSDRYTIAHEMLHLFGAWDLYYGNSQSKEKADQLERLYPNSVMINTHLNKEQLEVDELTAWRVGWNEDFKEWYNYFAPVWKDRSREHLEGVHWRFEIGSGKNKLRRALRKQGIEDTLFTDSRRPLRPTLPWLIGFEKSWARSWPGQKGYKSLGVQYGGVYLDVRLSPWLYLGTGIGTNEFGYRLDEVLDKATINHSLYPFFPNSATYQGPIPTRRENRYTFREYPLRLNIVFWQRERLELVVHNSITWRSYRERERRSYYWHDSPEEIVRTEGYWLHNPGFSTPSIRFTTGLGLRAFLLRRWQFQLNTQYGSQSGRLEVGNNKENFRLKTLGISAGLRYNLRGKKYLPLPAWI